MLGNRYLLVLLSIHCFIVFTGWADNRFYVSAHRNLQKREEVCRHFKAVWNYRVSITAEPIDANQLIDAVEKAKGGYVDEETRRKTLEEYAKARTCEHKAKMLIHRNADNLILKASQPACPGDAVSFYLYFTPSYAVYFPGDTESQGVISISPHHEPAVLNHLTLTYFIDPMDFAFLANYNILNALNLHKKGAWRVVEDTKHHLVLEATVTDPAFTLGYKFRRWKVVLAKAKGFAPEMAQQYAESQAEPDYEVKVTKWGQYCGLWVPVEFTRKLKLSLSEESYYFNLENFDAVNLPIALPFVEKAYVIDYRKSNRKNIPRTELSSIDYVTYEWKGKIPTEDEVKQMKSPDQEVTRSFSIVRYLMWLPPLVLILIGSVWILRTMRWRQG